MSWNVDDVLGFVEEARADGCAVSVGPGPVFISVQRVSSHEPLTHQSVRFWYDGEVDAIVGRMGARPHWVAPDIDAWRCVVGLGHRNP